ncbi:MAG: VWA domain-containing protein [Acidobacteria bacterium]|nr:VWA domain-containing protein [Acidobacteriota bacterium]
MYRLALRILWLPLLITVSLTAFAQTPQQSKPPVSDPDSTISIDTLEVLLPVTVRDKASGSFLTDLKAEEFTVFEDGVAQPISSFALKRMPVHVVLLIDTSSSVTKELDDFKASAFRFISSLDSEDNVSIITFADKVELVQDWTTSRPLLKRALNRLQGGMFTSFYDALWLAANEQLDKIKGRKAVIVLTDGIDNGNTRITYDRAFRALVEAEVPTYVVSKTRIEMRKTSEEVGFYEKNDSPLNRSRLTGLREYLTNLSDSETRLNKIAEETGGRIFLPQTFDDLTTAYQQVAEELRSQYVLFYTPTKVERDGKYRAVRVKVKRPGTHTATRFGYYAR